MVQFQEEAAALTHALEEWEAAYSAGEDVTKWQAMAQDQWVLTMGAWAKLDVMQIGPQASSLSAVSGGDIRDEIYSWPTSVNACVVDQITANESFLNGEFIAQTLVNGYGLDALEHLLFADFETNCPAQVPPLSDGRWDALLSLIHI